MPQYLIKTLFKEDSSVDFLINQIPFFVEKHATGYSDRISSHKQPTLYPSFILVASQWDDFGVKSSFDLFYYEKTGNPQYIGPVKIIYKTEYTFTKINKTCYITKDYLPNNFTSLTDEYCSLGQTTEYYDKIKNIFPKEYKGILWALRDAAIFSKIEEKFSQHKQFSSLIRENTAEQILRQEKYVIEGQNIKSRYQFSYKFTPKYTDETVTFDFKFDKDGILPNRIYAVIGKNGVGKTQFITTLPLDIANKKSSLFSPHIPIFSKIIAISNSYYDNFIIPKPTATFNYVYCGLSKLVKGERETLSSLALKHRLQKACKAIQNKERTDSLKKILSRILPKEDINDLFSFEEDKKLVFQFKNISSICDRISSGQNTLMFILCDVVSNIRYDSLLLFDEPETHLHPNAITSLMTAINELLNEYQSYCIISTHSPLIIRELFSRSVYIMERNANYPSVKKIGLESFGENLTTLTEEIFGNKEVEKYYKNKIQELIDTGYSYEKIIRLLENEATPLNLNIKIFIKNLIESSYEKN